MEFCKAFNSSTQKLEPGMPIPVTITVFADKSFTFAAKSPPASWFIRRAAKLEKGSSSPGLENRGQVTMDQLREIAEKKKEDLNANDVAAACRILAGSARSMGIEVVGS